MSPFDLFRRVEPDGRRVGALGTGHAGARERLDAELLRVVGGTASGLNFSRWGRLCRMGMKGADIRRHGARKDKQNLTGGRRENRGRTNPAPFPLLTPVAIAQLDMAVFTSVSCLAASACALTAAPIGFTSTVTLRILPVKELSRSL